MAKLPPELDEAGNPKAPKTIKFSAADRAIPPAPVVDLEATAQRPAGFKPPIPDYYKNTPELQSQLDNTKSIIDQGNAARSANAGKVGFNAAGVPDPYHPIGQAAQGGIAPPPKIGGFKMQNPVAAPAAQAITQGMEGSFIPAGQPTQPAIQVDSGGVARPPNSFPAVRPPAPVAGLPVPVASPQVPPVESIAQPQPSPRQPAVMRVDSNGVARPDWRTPSTSPEGIAARARATADSAAYTAQQAPAGTPPPVPPVATPTTGGGFDARGLANNAGPIAKSVWGGVKPIASMVSKVAAPLAATNAIVEGMSPNSTSAYAKRFGVEEPTGDGSVGDMAKFAAIRAGGAATDIASGLTFGLADGIYNDKQGIDAGKSAEMGTLAAGTWGGGKIGGKIGKGADAIARFATRGKYAGHMGETAGNFLGGSAGFGAGMTAVDLAKNEMTPTPAQAKPKMGVDGKPIIESTDQQPVTAQGSAAPAPDGKVPVPDGMKVSDTRVAGIKRIDGLNDSPTFTDNADRAITEKKSGYKAPIGADGEPMINTIAGGGTGGTREIMEPVSSSGPQVHYLNDRGFGWNPKEDAAGGMDPRKYDSIMAEAKTAIENGKTKRGNSLIAMAQAMQNSSNDAGRAALDEARQPAQQALIAAQTDASKLSGAVTQQNLAELKRASDLRTRYQASQDPAEKQAIQDELAILNGKNTQDDKLISVSEESTDPDTLATTKKPYLYNPRTGQAIDPLASITAKMPESPRPPKPGLIYAGTKTVNGVAHPLWKDAKGNMIIDNGK